VSWSTVQLIGARPGLLLPLALVVNVPLPPPWRWWPARTPSSSRHTEHRARRQLILDRALISPFPLVSNEVRGFRHSIPPKETW
jgi:hypothetical protein